MYLRITLLIFLCSCASRALPNTSEAPEDGASVPIPPSKGTSVENTVPQPDSANVEVLVTEKPHSPTEKEKSEKINTLAASSYALDAMVREVSTKGKIRCPKVPMIRYKGSILSYQKSFYVYEEFVPHLKKFEEIVRDSALQFYGRAPKRIRHLGVFNCRRVRKYPSLLSEHGIGNAIDVAGFDFGASKKHEKSSIRSAFTIRLEKHWSSKTKRGKIHGAFLRALIKRIIAADIFRVILGPAYPGHKNHFHFDMAPYRLIDV